MMIGLNKAVKYSKADKSLLEWPIVVLDVLKPTNSVLPSPLTSAKPAMVFVWFPGEFLRFSF